MEQSSVVPQLHQSSFGSPLPRPQVWLDSSIVPLYFPVQIVVGQMRLSQYAIDYIMRVVPPSHSTSKECEVCSHILSPVFERDGQCLFVAKFSLGKRTVCMLPTFLRKDTHTHTQRPHNVNITPFIQSSCSFNSVYAPMTCPTEMLSPFQWQPMVYGRFLTQSVYGVIYTYMYIHI